MILRETQNQNDADDANDAESGIWYRDILKTASRASSASLSSHKSSEGVWGTPQKCVCGYPNAMLAKHILSQGVSNQTGHPYKFVYISEWITFDSFKNLDSKKWIRSDSLSKVLLLFPFLHARGHHGDALFSGNGVTHLLKWQEKTRI
mgnify:FL=1